MSKTLFFCLYKQKLSTQIPSAFTPVQPTAFYNQPVYNPQVYNPQYNNSAAYNPQVYNPQYNNQTVYNPQSFQNCQQPSYAPPSSYNPQMQQYVSDYHQQIYPVVQPGVLDLSSSTSRSNHSSLQPYSSMLSANNFYGSQIAQQSEFKNFLLMKSV